MEFSGIYLKESSIVLSDESFNLISYDWEGRWYYAFIEGYGYRKGLNGRVLKKKRPVVHEVKERESLNRKIFELTLKILERKRVKKENEKLKLEEAEKVLKRGIDFWNKSEKEFYKIYSDISILPPDQYLSIYLQLTEGCNYGRCIFCDFYRKKTFKIKELKEFEEHLKRVYEFIGNGTSLRKSIFLGDANAILLPEKEFLRVLEIIRKYDEKRKIFSFMDMFTGIKKSEEFFREIRSYGFERVYIGLETGSKKLLYFLEKYQNPEDLKELVHKLKNSGINVGIIVMAGIGGDKFFDEHVEETSKILKGLPLDKKDIIYFSDFVIFEDLPYLKKAEKEGIRGLKREEMEMQKSLILQEIKDLPSILSFYNIIEFVY